MLRILSVLMISTILLIYEAVIIIPILICILNMCLFCHFLKKKSLHTGDTVAIGYAILSGHCSLECEGASDLWLISIHRSVN